MLAVDLVPDIFAGRTWIPSWVIVDQQDVNVGYFLDCLKLAIGCYHHRRITAPFRISRVLASISAQCLLSDRTPHNGSRSPPPSRSFSITSLKLSPSFFASDSFRYTSSLIARLLLAIRRYVYWSVY